MTVETTVGPLDEAELFAAYRTATGYSTQCACGGWIDAPSEATVATAVRIHNLTDAHEDWACGQRAVAALRRPTAHRCPCHGDEA